MEEYKMTKEEFIEEMTKNGAKKEDIKEYLGWKEKIGCPYEHCLDYWLGMSKEEFIKEMEKLNVHPELIEDYIEMHDRDKFTYECCLNIYKSLPVLNIIDDSFFGGDI